MSKAYKKQTIETLHTLQKAGELLIQLLAIGDMDNIMTVLTECQNGAIGVGTSIEEVCGEGTQTVHKLEAYCEAVYQLTQHLGDLSMQNECLTNLNSCIEQAIGCANEELSDQKEIVFLPYKASMWDSLESVWKKADADPVCDAYVIPIPYYDKNPDGSFRLLHYEGDEFPKDVLITHYEAYDFEKRRPDEIYIHNPYDDCNYVTSVHPHFYSKNLKEWTDKLVYIPYYVLGTMETAVGNQEVEDSIAHFITVPGVINAHQVIVQSEAMKQIYVNVLCREAGEETRDYWNEKILGLGSPKFDKIANTKREDIEIPQAWQKLMTKADGSHKKVILYNTSVSALLQEGDKMIAKIRDVLRVFYASREDVTLLWRPHPLIQATIESMRPQLWEEYREVVDSYVLQGWGIYDDTADLDRAIILSDAYYGDHSSVVQLCQKVGLPVMIQNVDVLQSFKN